MVACADAQVPVLIHEGCAPSTIRVIHNGVDPEQFSTSENRCITRTELGMNDDDVMVLVVASLSPQKNHMLLLRACARVMANGHSLHLVFAGEGPMRPQLESTIAALGMTGRVQLLAVRSDVAELLSASDVVALTSLPLIETFPMCLLEAMASGKPVVATRVGGIPELVEEGVTGSLVDSEDVNALSSAIEALATSNSLRTTMGSAARTRLERLFSLSKMTGAYESLFDAMLRDGEDGMG